MASTGQAQKYAAAWEAGLYDGFSEKTSARDSTPLLEGLIARLHSLNKTRFHSLNKDGVNLYQEGISLAKEEVVLSKERLPTHVLEAGAGLGSHAIRLVQEGFLVIANEYCETAAREIRRKRAQLPEHSQSRLKIIGGDILDCLRAQEEELIAGFYAHSVFHTFSAAERKLLYDEIRKIQPLDGILAISFKADGDYVQNSEGVIIEQTEVGRIVTDSAGGISRLFVTNPAPLAEELSNAGYSILNTYQWDALNIDDKTPLKSRKFVGLLAKKK